jgi:hypothetical protein
MLSLIGQRQDLNPTMVLQLLAKVAIPMSASPVLPGSL